MPEDSGPERGYTQWQTGRESFADNSRGLKIRAEVQNAVNRKQNTKRIKKVKRKEAQPETAVPQIHVILIFL